MQNIIKFPNRRRRKHLPVDWEHIESVRKQRYPDIPEDFIALIRHVREAETGIRERVNWSLEINFDRNGYPPEIIESSLNTAEIEWVLDLLDRFGGELYCGDEYCIITRKEPRLPVLWINQIDPTTLEAIEMNSEFLYEHFIRSKGNWMVFGKNLPGANLIFIIIRFLNNDDLRYGGLIDKDTFRISFARLKEGTPIEEVLMLEQN